MTALPQTRIPQTLQEDIVEKVERFIDAEARWLQSRGIYPSSPEGVTIARLEVALTIGAHDVVEHAVAHAREAGVSWDSIAKLAGLASRGSAARRFGSVRGSENETSTRAAIRTLHRAKALRSDEFFTRYEDVERELAHYPDAFRGKTVLSNCDDADSAFWRYFETNFTQLGLHRLIATHYAPHGESFVREATSEGMTLTPLEGDGDFGSPEALALLDESDIVVTNPPFSRFREFMSTLAERDKEFLILGSKNAVTYKEMWRQIANGRMRLGATPLGQDMLFGLPPEYADELRRARQEGATWRETDGVVYGRVSACWFTTLDHDRRHQELPLVRRYADDPSRYPQYDNFHAIEVGSVADIPGDYEGVMGVPITFLGRHNPHQFEIVGYSRTPHAPDNLLLHVGQDHSQPYVRGAATYDRIFIRRTTTATGATV